MPVNAHGLYPPRCSDQAMHCRTSYKSLPIKLLGGGLSGRADCGNYYLWKLRGYKNHAEQAQA